MTDSLKFVFPDAIRKKLTQKKNTSKLLQFRLAVLAASGPPPVNFGLQRRLIELRKQKAAWEAYIDAARVIRLFWGSHGNDLLARLRSPKDEDFRGAMAECMTAWIFKMKFKFAVQPRPMGRQGRPLEMMIRTASDKIFTEVKSPYKDLPEGLKAWSGDDADVLKQALESANDQFEKGKINILVICPQLRTPVYMHRSQLIRAFIAEEYISIPIDLKRGTALGPGVSVSKPTGHFSKVWKNEDGTSSPRYTRTSGVLVIEENNNGPYMTHHLFLVHNPSSTKPVSTSIWGTIPQFCIIGDKMAWTDGASAFQ